MTIVESGIRTGKASWGVGYYLLALALGAATGYIDYVTGEVFITALLLLALGMGFGLWRPGRGWAAGIALALGVTAARVVAHLMRPLPHIGDIPATLLAAIPAVVGGAAGGLLRTTARHIFSDRE